VDPVPDVLREDPVPRRIAFVSPCGGGNLGDAAIIDSLIGGIRARVPDAEIVGFTGNPGDTARRHGVDAFPLRAALGVQTPAAAADGAEPVGEEPAHRGEPLWKRLLRRVPAAQSSRRTAVRLMADTRYYRQVEQRLRGYDLIVVAGGGQFDELFGGPFRHPYTLWRFGMMARSVGARFAILSVGTGTLRRVGRLFVRRTLALADWASFRDSRSRQLVGAGAARAAVVPDLAYGRQLERQPAPVAPADPSARSVVGVSPMAYGDPRFWPRHDQALYRQHVASLARLTIDLLGAGHEVVLFSTDGPDRLSVEELRSEVGPALRPEQRARLRVPEVGSVERLLEILGSVEVVVAARFHGVLLAHLVGRPALAIAHERKVATLMDEMGQSRFCTPIDSFDVAGARRTFDEMHAGRAALAADIRTRVAQYRRRVDDQYDRLLGLSPSQSPAGVS
jgi:polysaccharide pyruvyl transferase WcaK-like protein